MEVSILATLVMRHLGVGKIIARAISPMHGQVLHEIGATKVVHIEEQMGEQVAKSIVTSNVFEHITFPAGYRLMEMAAPSAFVGKTLQQLSLRQKYGVLCVALQRREPTVDNLGHSTMRTETKLTPNPGDIIRAQDVLVLVGTEAGLSSIVEL